MELIGIVAATQDRVIGNEGKIPWRIPEDMRHFKELTMGNTVIMGRETYEGIKKGLPGRNVIVLTRQEDWTSKGVQVAHSGEEAVALALLTPEKKVYIGGGQKVYELFWSSLTSIELTVIKERYRGDALCPPIPKIFRLKHSESHEKYTFGTWVRT